MPKSGCRIFATVTRFEDFELDCETAELYKNGRRLKLRYLPGYSPECMPMEWLWEDWRDQVTHNHDRAEIKCLEHDSDNYFARCARNPQKVLRTIGSPFAGHQNRKT